MTASAYNLEGIYETLVNYSDVIYDQLWREKIRNTLEPFY